MRKINLDELIKERNLDYRVLAGLLFPNNLHPVDALARVAAGAAELKESQIIALSEFTGLDPSTLFSGEWKGGVTENGLVFTRGNVRAVFNPSTRLTNLYDLKGAKLSEFILLGETVSVTSYLNRLDLEVNKLINS